METLREQGLKAVHLYEGSIDDAVGRALEAMRTGVDVIVQPALRDGRWFGRPGIFGRIIARTLRGVRRG